MFPDENHQEMLRALFQSKDEIWASLELQVQELEAILSRYNPLDVMGNILFVNAAFDAETYKEYSHEGRDAYIEYVTLLLLTKPFDTYATHTTELVPTNDIQQRVSSIFDTLMQFLIVKDIDPKKLTQTNDITQLQHRVIVDSILVRYPSYHHHLREILIDLFTPLHTELKSILGCTIQDALAMIDGMETIMARRMGEKRAKAREPEKDIKAQVKRYRIKQNKKKGEKPDQIPEEEAMYQKWGLLRPREAAEKIQHMVTLWLLYSIGDTISFTPQDLADELQIEIAKVQTFLERLSLSFGEVNPEHHRFPAATHPLMLKPFVRHGDQFLRPVKDLSYWSLRPAIEALLKYNKAENINHNQALWARYDKIRADYVEKKSLEYLGNALHADQAHQSLKYWVTEQGKRKEVELDGLLIVGSALFLVEAKAGSVTQPARRGAEASLRKDLQKLVGNAYSQALRAKKYIQEMKQPIFTLSDGSILQVPKEDIDHTFLVSVTLDAIDVFASNISQFPGLGFFEKGDFPWAVSLTDLRVISELVESPSQFIHYLTRRLRINEHRRAQTYDELDWFGTYLQNGLYFEDLLDKQDAPDMILVQPATTDFDDYYFYITGQRKTPVPKPAQPMPEVMRKMLMELESSHASKYLEIACAFLDMSFTTREKFVNIFTQQRERTLHDQQLHDFTLQLERRNTSITCMFAPLKHIQELEAKLTNYCMFKKYQTKSNLWIGLACIVDESSLLQGSIVLQDSWKYDPEMEHRLINDFPTSEEQ